MIFCISEPERDCELGSCDNCKARELLKDLYKEMRHQGKCALMNRGNMPFSKKATQIWFDTKCDCIKLRIKQVLGSQLENE